MDPLTRFNALPEDARRRILDDHRDWYTEGDWWDTTYEQFRYAMNEIGIRVEQISFSGFGSQGDGASFTGGVRDWEAFLGTHMPNMNPAHRSHLVENADFCMRRGRLNYSHEFTVHGVMEGAYIDPCNFDRMSPYDDELRTAVWELQMDNFDEAEYASAIEDIFRDHMRALYKALEARYDDLQSDEVVLEALLDTGTLDELLDTCEA